MPLPKIATPSYELELPSTGKTISYRPFLVKEEKLAKLSTKFNSKSNRLIIKVDKKTVLDEIIVNEINIKKS